MSQAFTILVSGGPTGSQAHLSAMRFIRAALGSGYQISQVFFYQDAVYIGNRFTDRPDDELQIAQEWLELATEYQFELQLCVAAASRRGIVDEETSVASGDNSILPGFALLGLGQLAASLSKGQNKLVHFK